LTVSPVPITVPAFRVFMIWKAAQNDDEQNAWLRSFVIDTTRELQFAGSYGIAGSPRRKGAKAPTTKLRS
jgi:LysR family transcriptional activator of mexEF-oprN operon